MYSFDGSIFTSSNDDLIGVMYINHLVTTPYLISLSYD